MRPKPTDISWLRTYQLLSPQELSAEIDDLRRILKDTQTLCTSPLREAIRLRTALQERKAAHVTRTNQRLRAQELTRKIASTTSR